jgi:hypothetical protein
MVISGQGALVRKDVELSSPEVYSLKFGDVVTCAEIVGRRARIIDPVEGWVSLATSDNEPLFELTFPPDKRTQVRTMERRFEKLKQQQAERRIGETSPVAMPQVHRVSDEPAPKDGVNTLKTKIVFKSPSTIHDEAVPRLDANALKKPQKAPTVSSELASQDLLLDFDSPQQPTSLSTPELKMDQKDSDFSLL